MTDHDEVLVLNTEDPLAVAAVSAIHTGDVAALQRLLARQPRLATARLGDYDGRPGCGMSRTLLHVVTDWPGHFPNGAATVAALVAAGADVNARFTGPHTETPLHWAGSPTGRSSPHWTPRSAAVPPNWPAGCAGGPR